MPRTDLQLRSLGIATDIDVLSDEAVIEERDGYVVVRSPANVGHYWGNFLVFERPPVVGDRVRWEELFEREIASLQPRTEHVSFTWDVTTDELGATQSELLDAGYDLDHTSVLVATPDELTLHARANRDVEIRELDPRPGQDEDAWSAIVELQTQARAPGHTEAAYRSFARARTDARRARFVVGDGGWFAATIDGELAGSLGVIVTDGRARYQTVDTAERFRRRGVATRLVHDAGRVAVDRYGAQQLVILADVGYHALALYESVGFVERQRALGVTWWPTAPHAGLHPTRAQLARPL